MSKDLERKISEHCATWEEVQKENINLVTSVKIIFL